MRVVAYSIKSFEKEPLAIANNKKHEITLISNSLSLETAAYAEGKEAVIVFNEEDNVSALVINKLADLGVKFIATRSTDTTHIDTEAAGLRSLKIANVPLASLSGLSEKELPMALATETIINLDNWQQNRCLGDACVCSKACDQAASKVHIKGQPHQH